MITFLVHLVMYRHRANLFESHPRDELIAFSIAILKSPNYIKNPYLKSKLVEILFYFTMPLYRTPDGRGTGPRLDHVFGTHPYAREHLVSCVMRYYVYVENTGVTSAFYDKFTIRYHIAQIMKSLWEDLAQRVRVIEESR
jgi:ubiquitin conjugation factor E4 B